MNFVKGQQKKQKIYYRAVKMRTFYQRIEKKTVFHHRVTETFFKGSQKMQISLKKAKRRKCKFRQRIPKKANFVCLQMECKFRVTTAEKTLFSSKNRVKTLISAKNRKKDSYSVKEPIQLRIS